MELIECDVLPYSVTELKRLLTQLTEAPDFVVDRKVQCEYLDSYLKDADIGAQTMVVEQNYVDRDFLADYSGYYIRCFYPYRRWCSRFHFFSAKFGKDDLLALLSGTATGITEQKLRESYIGFTVAKPLPETIFGRTCFKTFPADQSSGRNFPNVRDYKVNLFGIDLKIRTIAFQEQDTVAAACATSAIWCAFQGTGVLFQHQIPSPLTITRAAIQNSPTLHRPFPAAAGLTAVQIAQAVRSVGLDPLHIQLRSNWVTQAVLYAYLRAAIPVLVNGSACDISLSTGMDADQLTNSGHTITAVGYRLEDAKAAVPGPTGILLTSSKVTRLYVHDDGVGPFARLEFEPSTIPIQLDPQSISNADWLSARWGTSGAGRLYVPLNVIVPIITTVRIPFLLVLEAVLAFDLTLEIFRSGMNPPIFTAQERLEWDIHLTSANALKADLLADANLDPANKQFALMTALPRFVWRVTAKCGGQRKMDFLFDSTDIEQGPMLISVVSYDDQMLGQLLIVSQIFTSFPQYELERLLPQGKFWEHLRKIAMFLQQQTINQP